MTQAEEAFRQTNYNFTSLRQKDVSSRATDGRLRGESLGEAAGGKKYTFRIRKDGMREKASQQQLPGVVVDSRPMHVTTTGFGRVGFEGVYTSNRERSAAPRDKLPFKEMSLNERVSKQMAIEGQAAVRANKLFESRNGSKDEATAVRKNNFLATGGFMQKLGDTQTGFRQTRHYEKPWLKNTAQQFTETSNVGIAHAGLAQDRRQLRTASAKRGASEGC